MEQNVFTDKEQFPTGEAIFSHIGKSTVLWEEIFGYIRTHNPDFSEQWRYYTDGKSWLLKVTRKSKTIFWLSVLPQEFRITFYFGDKAESFILNSALSQRLKNQFKDGKKYGKIRGITIIIKNKEDVEDVICLIDIKLRIK